MNGDFLKIFLILNAYWDSIIRHSYLCLDDLRRVNGFLGNSLSSSNQYFVNILSIS